MTLYEEASGIAVTAEQKRNAEWLRAFARSRLTDDTKPTRHDEFGFVQNVDLQHPDELAVGPLR